MKNSIYNFSGKAAVIVFVILLAGCGSSPSSRFYLLSPLAGGSPQPPAGGRCVTLTIGPVIMPEYVNRPQIVTRATQNELVLGTFDRWGEPLSDMVPRIIAENLSALLCTKGIYPFKWQPAAPSDYGVEVVVIQMDGILGKETALDAWWTISNKDDVALVTRAFKLAEPVQGEGYLALVQAQSRMIGALSREIANAIEGFSGQSSAR